MRTSYAGLTHIWKIMALDLGLLLAEWVFSILDILLLIILPPDAASAVIESRINVYLSWTFRCLRPLLWVGMIVLLSRSEEYFHTARIWYLLRIIAFFALRALGGIAGQIDQAVGIILFSGGITVSEAVCILLLLLISPLLAPLGNRAVLNVGGAVLDYFGLEAPAKKNRRCGKLLAVFTCLLAGMISVFLALFCFILQTTEYSLLEYLEAPDGSALIQWTMFLLPALMLLCGVGILILWGMSAVRMKRTCNLVKGLSE